MIIIKAVEVGLNIPNPIDVFSDIDGNLLSILVSEYENKCFRSCFVKRVIRVLERSECVIAQEGDACHGKMNVRFEVEAIVYARDELIHGCVVKNKDRSGVIIASTPYSSIFLNAHASTASISVGQTISVRVGSAVYKYGATSVSINAYPVAFSAAYNVYHVNKDSLNDEEMQLVKISLDRAKEEEALAADAKKKNAKGWEFFNKLMYAYKGDQSPPSKASAIQLVDIVTKNTGLAGYYARDPRILPTTPTAFRYAKAGDIDDPESNLRREISPVNALIAMIEDYAASLRSVREMINIYNSDELLASHKNVWLIYMRAKLG